MRTKSDNELFAHIHGFAGLCRPILRHHPRPALVLDPSLVPGPSVQDVSEIADSQPRGLLGTRIGGLPHLLRVLRHRSRWLRRKNCMWFKKLGLSRPQYTLM